MLQPREADIPVLFLFFVVLPLVTYFLLGKCNDISKKKARVTVLARFAAEEALAVEAMATVDVVPAAPLSNFGGHVCARCFRPATTRCSRCKSVRYCSGKCQIIHWRRGHKQECQQWKNDSSSIPVSPAASMESDHYVASSDTLAKTALCKNDEKEFLHNIDASDLPNSPANLFHMSTLENKLPFKQDADKTKNELSRQEKDASCCLKEASSCVATAPLHASTEFSDLPSNEYTKRYKALLQSGNDTYIASNSLCINRKNTSQPTGHSSTQPRNIPCETQNLKFQVKSIIEPSNPGDTAFLLFPERNILSRCKTETEKTRSPGLEFSSIGELGLNSSPEKLSAMGGMKFRRPPYTVESSFVSKGNSISGIERKAGVENDSTTATGSISIQDTNGISKTREKKMPSMKITQKPPKHNTGTSSSYSLGKNKVLFPYEDLVKLFEWEISDVYPRGLLNCGNSCYANAVLQCLTSTKPLLVYLLRGIHSRSCYMRDWCLMCELELHVSTLLEPGGPLSPSKVLSNMRNIGYRIGGGNQEDAHEFLRLLVTSMQSICLDGVGGEKEVHPGVQETTLIQQIFGGRLKSKVKCLRCESESERYENIMDLTLEIHGWVESLEDALTQFTAPEDLDGDNMYRCGRCCAYVKARKQLNVHEAPNILTIVLKRFQTGKYGKINKCVAFPDMLHMNPFMTGTSDRPPVYLLYAVVVHLDTLNASFSGHYVSYVKDWQGNWFRIDDTEVQAVSLSRVMSEGAYMLFYARSFPRPPRIYSGKATEAAKDSTYKPPPKQLRHGSTKTNPTSPSLRAEARPEEKRLFSERESCYSFANDNIKNAGGRDMLRKHGNAMDLSADCCSSDWSRFTSSDESSFTTESTSDSFSTVDYSDDGSMDPISSLFNPVYHTTPAHYTTTTTSRKSTILCRDFSRCRSNTRFFSESRSFALDSAAFTHGKGKIPEGTTNSSARERSQR